MRRCGEEFSPLGKGAGDGRTDCHSQFENWPRNDREVYMGCGTRPGGSSGRPTPTHHSPIELRRGRRPRRPALPWARCGLAMTHYKKCGTNPAGDRKGRPYGGLQAVQGAGRCGERTERCRWQRKRSERVAAVKILSVRRKAAQKFWAPQQDHRPLRVHNKRCGEGIPPLGKRA